MKWWSVSRLITNSPCHFIQDSLPQWSHSFNSHSHGKPFTGLSLKHLLTICVQRIIGHFLWEILKHIKLHMSKIKLMTSTYFCPFLYTGVGSWTQLIVQLRNLNVILETSIFFYCCIHLIIKLCTFCILNSSLSVLSIFFTFINFSLVHTTFFTCSEWWQ